MDINKYEHEREKELEMRLAEFPIYQMGWLDTEKIVFRSEVRNICREECVRYGSSWACPPGVGSLEECRERCRGYNRCFLFSTLAEVEDMEDMEGMLKTRLPHEKMTRRIAEIVREIYGEDIYPLSTESCEICGNCSYPEAPCRHPEYMFPSIESHGILVTQVAEEAGMEFMSDMSNVVIWFSMILVRQ